MLSKFVNCLFVYSNSGKNYNNNFIPKYVQEKPKLAG